MKPKKILLAALSLFALALELLPNGVVLNFGNPEGEPFRSTYSYFDLTPFGYANFGPFITAILTCVLVILAAVYWFKPSKGLNTAMLNVSGVATAASLMPLMFGVSYFSVIAVLVTALLACLFVCSFIGIKKTY